MPGRESEAMPKGVTAEGGIFTPWDQILARLERQYDAIIAKLDSKVDVGTFQSFQANYETRHERLQAAMEAFIKEAHERWEQLDKEQSRRDADVDRRLRDAEASRERVIPQFEEAQDSIDALLKDKAARDATRAQTRYWLAGGGLVGVLVLVNLIATAWQIAHNL